MSFIDFRSIDRSIVLRYLPAYFQQAAENIQTKLYKWNVNRMEAY